LAVRKIIQIDEDKCNGCGQCVEACAEGAIEVRGGKAKVIRDMYCDGLGACLGECPQGALTIVEREAEEFDEVAVHRHLGSRDSPPACGCPSAVPMVMSPSPPISVSGGSDLTNWPIQMRLVSPSAPYFKDASLLLAGDCTAFAFAAMHPEFIRRRTTIIGCPKLDDNEEFVNKLTAILSANEIKDITMVHMEVPCCGQMKRLAAEALRRANSDVPIRSYTVRRSGELIEDKG
jgi:NAD-dependent dihydropyrimidine dehydrogenase PreA subunit